MGSGWGAQLPVGRCRWLTQECSDAGSERQLGASDGSIPGPFALLSRSDYCESEVTGTLCWLLACAFRLSHTLRKVCLRIICHMSYMPYIKDPIPHIFCHISYITYHIASVIYTSYPICIYIYIHTHTYIYIYI